MYCEDSCCLCSVAIADIVCPTDRLFFLVRHWRSRFDLASLIDSPYFYVKDLVFNQQSLSRA